MLDAALCAQQRGALPSAITLRALLFLKATVMLCALSPMCHQTGFARVGWEGPLICADQACLEAGGI